MQDSLSDHFDRSNDCSDASSLWISFWLNRVGWSFADVVSLKNTSVKLIRGFGRPIKHGFVDAIVKRRDLPDTIASLMIARGVLRWILQKYSVSRVVWRFDFATGILMNPIIWWPFFRDDGQLLVVSAGLRAFIVLVSKRQRACTTSNGIGQLHPEYYRKAHLMVKLSVGCPAVTFTTAGAYPVSKAKNVDREKLLLVISWKWVIESS